MFHILCYNVLDPSTSLRKHLVILGANHLTSGKTVLEVSGAKKYPREAIITLCYIEKPTFVFSHLVKAIKFSA